MWQKNIQRTVLLGGLLLSTGSPASVLPLLVKVEGELHIQKKDSDVFKPTGIGERLGRYDFLKAEEGTRAAVLCPQLVVKYIPGGETKSVRNVCGVKITTRTLRNGNEINSQLGGTDSSIPYVISPRSSRILTLKTVRWNAVPGVDSYTMEIVDGRENTIVKKQSTHPSVLLDPDEITRLQPETTYFVWVYTDDNQSSSNDNGGESGFRISSAKDYVDMTKEADSIRGSHIGSEEKAIALAELYSDREFYDEAIAVLGKVYSDSSPAYIARKLGDLYAQVGLNLLSRKSYRNAKYLARQQGDRYEQKKAGAGLSEIAGNIEIGNVEEVPAAFVK